MKSKYKLIFLILSIMFVLFKNRFLIACEYCEFKITNINKIISNYILFNTKNLNVTRITNDVIEDEIVSEIVFEEFKEGENLDVKFYKGEKISIIYRVFKITKEKYRRYIDRLKNNKTNSKPDEYYKGYFRDEKIDNVNFIEFGSIYFSDNNIIDEELYEFNKFIEPDICYVIVIFIDDQKYNIKDILKRFKIVKKG